MKSKILFWGRALMLLLAGSCKQENTGRQPAPRLEIYAKLDQSAGNIAYGHDGALIYSRHPFYKPSVRVIRRNPANGAEAPFPNMQWNESLTAETDRYLIDVLGIRNDKDGVVWMLDLGYREGETPVGFIEPKIVGWCTQTNQLQRVYKIKPPALRSSSQLQDMVVDLTHHVFIIADEDIGPGGDGSRGALVIVDINTMEARRVLEGNESTRADIARPIVVDGKTLHGGNGNPLLVGADGITADKNNEWLYYGPLSGSKVYRIKIEDLLNINLSEEERARRVEPYADKENNGGLSIDGEGNLYLTNVQTKSIGVVRPSEPAAYRYIEDSRMVWPDGLSYNSKDGYMYVPATQIPLAPSFNGGQDLTVMPFYILRFKPLAEGISGR